MRDTRFELRIDDDGAAASLSIHAEGPKTIQPHRVVLGSSPTELAGPYRMVHRTMHSVVSSGTRIDLGYSKTLRAADNAGVGASFADAPDRMFESAADRWDIPGVAAMGVGLTRLIMSYETTVKWAVREDARSMRVGFGKHAVSCDFVVHADVSPGSTFRFVSAVDDRVVSLDRGGAFRIPVRLGVTHVAFVDDFPILQTGCTSKFLVTLIDSSKLIETDWDGDDVVRVVADGAVAAWTIDAAGGRASVPRQSQSFSLTGLSEATITVDGLDVLRCDRRLMHVFKVAVPKAPVGCIPTVVPDDSCHFEMIGRGHGHVDRDLAERIGQGPRTDGARDPMSWRMAARSRDARRGRGKRSAKK